MAGKAKDITGYTTESGITVIKRVENKGTKPQWLCKCFCEVSAAHLTEHHGTQSCGCIQSKGEAKIKQILEKNNIPYISQFSISSCIFPDTNYPARFDFYVNNQYIIEYDGNVHYYSNGYGWNNEDNLTKVKNHDIIKNEWCKNNNIPLIRIPYTIYDNLSLDDLLLETSKYIVKGDNNE